MGKAELEDKIVPYKTSRWSVPDLELGILDGRMMIVTSDHRYGFVTNARSKQEAQDFIEDVEEELGIMLSMGHPINIKKTERNSGVARGRFEVGIWQRGIPYV